MNRFVMKESGTIRRRFSFCPAPFVRVLVSAVLVAALALEILPGGVETAPAVAGGTSEYAFRIEPLQVCDHGDPFVGVLFDLPVLLPGAPSLFVSTETRQFAQPAAVFVPDGHLPSVDHPPQLSA